MAREPARPWHLYALAAAIGLAIYLIVYGPGHLLGTTAYWEMPNADERQSLIGYRYFLHAPWHWPLFVSDQINVPYAKSVAFLDCVPLWALANKMIASVVPPWASFSEHAYLGMWHAIVYVLQACLGVAVLRALGHRSWRAGLVGALFFVAMPTWIFRYNHTAAGAHWLLLWALYLYIRTPPRTRVSRRLGALWLCQLAVAALVYPYHAVISLAVFVAALARARDVRWLPLGLASVLAATALVGYFAHETARPQWGFEYESANLLSWLVPVHSGIVGDARWIANVMGTDWQYEGYAYLGLGCLLLLAWLARHAKVLREVVARHAVLFAIACGFAILALSNHIYFGSHEIVSFPIPSFLRWIPHQFRSPGRFVWLPTYVLVAFLLHWALQRRFAVVAVATALQLLDARGDWALQRANTRGASAVQLDIAAWRPLVHAHDAVVVLPPYSCRTGDDVPTLDDVAMDIEMLASERALPINGTYSARPWRRCAAEQKEWPTLDPRAGTLYVLLPPALGVADVLAARGARCGVFAHGRVCSMELAASFLQPMPPPLALARGGELAVDWIDSPLAALRIAAEPGTLHVEAEAQLCGARQTQDLDVLVDGTPAGTLHFPGAAPLAIPGGRTLTLELVPRDRRTPEQLGCGADARGYGVRARLTLQ